VFKYIVGKQTSHMYPEWRWNTDILTTLSSWQASSQLRLVVNYDTSLNTVKQCKNIHFSTREVCPSLRALCQFAFCEALSGRASHWATSRLVNVKLYCQTSSTTYRL